MNPGWLQCALLLEQKCQPKTHAVLRQSERNFTFVLAPDCDWRAAETAVDRLMLGADNVEGDVSLEFPQSQSGMPLRVVFAKFLRIAEGGAR